MADTRSTLPSVAIIDDPLKEMLDETRESRALTLFDLVKHEGYTLIIDPSPQERPDAIGNTGWKRMASAQLCQNKQIAVTEGMQNATYCISHEIAHGKYGFDDEKVVCIEQASILAGWVELLMKNIRGEL